MSKKDPRLPKQPDLVENLTGFWLSRYDKDTQTHQKYQVPKGQLCKVIQHGIDEYGTYYVIVRPLKYQTPLKLGSSAFRHMDQYGKRQK